MSLAEFLCMFVVFLSLSKIHSQVPSVISDQDAQEHSKHRGQTVFAETLGHEVDTTAAEQSQAWDGQDKTVYLLMSTLLESRQWANPCILCIGTEPWCRRVMLPNLISHPVMLLKKHQRLNLKSKKSSHPWWSTKRQFSFRKYQVLVACDLILVLVPSLAHIIATIHNLSVMWLPPKSYMIVVFDTNNTLASVIDDERYQDEILEENDLSNATLPELGYLNPRYILPYEPPPEQSDPSQDFADHLFLDNSFMEHSAGVLELKSVLNNTEYRSPELLSILELLWRFRRVYRAIVYQLSSPQQVLTFDLFQSTVLAFGLNETECLLDVLTRNITNMNQQTLRVILFERPPTVLSLSGRLWGMDTWMLQLFAEKMNFTALITGTTDGTTYGYHFTNGSYSGTVLDLVVGRADVAFNGHFALDYKSTAVWLSTPVDWDELCLVVPAAGRFPHWAVLLHAFRPKLVLAFSVVSAGILVILCLMRLAAGSEVCFWDMLFFTAKLLMAAPAGRLPRIYSQRIVIAACAIFSVFSSNAFQSMVATSLTLPLILPEMDSLQDVADSDLPLYTTSNSLKETFAFDGKTAIKQLYENTIIVNDEKTWRQLTRSGQFATFTRRHAARLLVPGDRHIVKECPRQYFVSYLTTRGSPFLHPLNDVILRLTSAGIVRYLWSRSHFGYHVHIDNSNSSNCVPTSEVGQVFTLNDLIGAFILLGSGLVTSFVVFLVELLCALRGAGRLQQEQGPAGRRSVTLRRPSSPQH